MKAKNLPKNAFKTQSNVLVVICSFIIAVLLSGCSITGALIGSKIKSKENIRVSGSEIDKIGKDNHVKVVFKNADTLQGFFKGTDLVPLDEYTPVYQEGSSKLSLNFTLPQPGDTFTFKIIKGNSSIQLKNITYSYIFEGFDLNRVILKDSKNNIKLYLLSDIFSTNLNLSKINDLIISGEIPTRTILNVSTIDGIKKIKPSDIHYVDFQKPKSHTFPGFVIGLVADIFITPRIVFFLAYFLSS
ncbi:MAG: hypothetical protein RIR48_360 [Bacteroidota bacterium]|jgi:hypothetical protein